MGAALSHSLHHSRRPAQVQKCARLMSICSQLPQESSNCMLASMHASTYFQHPFCTEIACGISSSNDSVHKHQLQKEQHELQSRGEELSTSCSASPPLCAGLPIRVCGLEDGADSRGMKAKTHVIIFQITHPSHFELFLKHIIKQMCSESTEEQQQGNYLQVV
ncbi:hypothetical protein WJX82_005417 [Trebouxia sp. C0006]